MLKTTLFLFLFIPFIVFAQDATNVIPQKNRPNDTARQTDLIDIGKNIFHIELHGPRVRREKKVYFSILPVPGNVNGSTGRALVTSTTAAIYLGSPQSTYLSSANFAPYWNFKKRFGLPLRTSIWLPDNTWNIEGDVRFLVYPQFTWGLGTANSAGDRTLADNNYIRFYQSALKRITPYFFAGFGYNLDYHTGIKSDRPNVNLQQFTGYKYGTQGSSFAQGVSFNLLYDTRNNSLNPLPGAYANVVYRVNPGFLGSNNTWTSLYVDLRKYIALNPAKPFQQNTLAFWSYFWTVFDGKAPYFDLPSIGLDPYGRSGRGIDQNRYRGQSLLYFETEYRRDITNNGLLGFVLFANVNTISGSGTFLTSWHPAAGPGLRVKFNKGSNTNIGMDYGVSKGFTSLIFNIGETF